MEYMFIKGTERLFVLFHGTGGNENSLLFLTGELDPYASVLSFLGNVGIGKNRRFFAPLVNKKMDKNEVTRRSYEFFKKWDSFKFDEIKEIVFIGYSNGANFILGLLQERPDIANKTILLHPSNLGWIFKEKPLKNKIIATTGASDIIAPAGDVMKLKKEFENIGYKDFQVILLDGGHGISDEEVEKLKKFK
ncbi:hypothetical protein EII29_10175 [Leptotrichia sp. OH3620_COT-345]|uniref:alpha/beta hydrolase n=1 Tax=Leptotrichia sp. OH3620_COT-345 TaxID=2491048 RepID=UPI000F651711|nr:dienelactone hydrolase family protein [Leptotrichia sp. OH3620_COT-345]RRD38463.1 hypothetical protein EII29_10175 [Leptotrichia sp. OH3620_COT-345]